MRQPNKKIEPASGRWENFKIPAGSSSEVRQRVAELREQVQRESKVLSTNSLLNGGTKVRR